MNASEAKEFIDLSFTMFPGMQAWLSRNSPNPENTKALWAESFAGIEFREAMSVLKRWNSGQLEFVKSYERDSFPLHVRSIIAEDRRKAKARAAAEQRAVEADPDHNRNFQGGILGPFMAEVMWLKARHDAGELDRRQFENRVYQCEQHAMRCAEQKKPFRSEEISR